jgi:hypothetical protein
MKSKKLAIGLSVIIFVALILRFVPLYSKSVEVCAQKNTTIHKSLILGSSKAEIDQEAQESVSSSSVYDCPISTVTYKLSIL